MIINPYRFAAAAAAASVGRALIYTGNGGTKNVTGAGFQPDLVAIKARGTTTGWRWTDSSRGVTKSLDTSGNSSEATEATGLTSFDSDGFSLGADADYNANAGTFLALCFRKLAGAFDIVTYTGNSTAGRTVSHALGVVPELIIIKNRTTGATSFAVYPGPLSSPQTKSLLFNTTGAVGASGGPFWNSTAPTSAVFSLGTSSSVNSSSNDYVAWLFASKTGSVKIGTYTGDGNTTGPFVTTGFQPRFVLVKRTDAAGDWILFDRARDTSNPSGIYNKTNSTVAESTLADGIDMQSTGFAFTDTGAAAGVNINTATYIYLAVA